MSGMDPLAMQVWSDKFLMSFNDAHVFKKGTNQNYEDEVRYNESVRIWTPARPTTSSYTKDGTITYQRLTPTGQVFIADQRQVFGLRVDNLEKHIAKMGAKMWEAELQGGAWELEDDVDDFVRDLMVNGVAPINVLAPRQLGTGLMTMSAYDLIVEAETMAKNRKWTPGGWHMFVPPDFSGLLNRDPKFVGFGTDNSRKTIRGAMEATPIRGFEYHETTNGSVSGISHTIVFCHEDATTYGEVLSELRHIPVTAGDKDERADSELVFGGKVTRPDGVITCTIQFAQ